MVSTRERRIVGLIVYLKKRKISQRKINPTGTAIMGSVILRTNNKHCNKWKTRMAGSRCSEGEGFIICNCEESSNMALKKIDLYLLLRSAILIQ